MATLENGSYGPEWAMFAVANRAVGVGALSALLGFVFVYEFF
jgi:hypothetical protein